MKKYLLLSIALLSVCIVKAERLAVGYDELPAKARQFVTTYFTDAGIAGVAMNKDFMNNSYDLYFTDGRKVEFDKRGEWIEIDCVRSAVPTGIVPEKIVEFLKANNQDNYIVKIERDKNICKIKLDNGIKAEFDNKGVFIGYDD